MPRLWQPSGLTISRDELSEFAGKTRVTDLDKAEDTRSKASLLHTTTLAPFSVRLKHICHCLLKLYEFA